MKSIKAKVRGKTMKENVCRCERCGTIFTDPKYLNPYDMWSQPEYGCPVCGSSYQVGNICDNCGEFHEVEDCENELYCKDCTAKAVGAMEQYMVNNVPMSDADKKIFMSYWECL